MINIKQTLISKAKQDSIEYDSFQFPDCELEVHKIKAVIINEVVPKNPDDWFYSDAIDAENKRTAFGIFNLAGVIIKSIQDLLDQGIYITAALKTPKEGHTADPEMIKTQLPLLEAELSLFPNLNVIMLMGDVAKKAFNFIAKEKTRKNLIPSKPTYLTRGNEYYFQNVRVMPSYIITGKNLLIEKGKCVTIAEDIRKMMEIIK